MKSVLPILLLTSLIALPSWADSHDKGGCHHKGKARYEEALSKLPKERADLVRSTFEKAKVSQESTREKGRKLHEELEAISTAETFDREAFLAKRAEIRKLRNDSGMAWDQTIADLNAQLTVEERRTLAEARQWKHRKDEGQDAKAGAE